MQSEALGNAGGFSGAEIWRVRSEGLAPTYCLRKWPSENPDRKQLEWMHGVLIHARTVGVEVIPRIYRTVERETIVAYRGAFWELTDWMPGVADFFSNPSQARRQDLFQRVAECHRGFAQYQLDFRASAGVKARYQGIGELDGFLNQLPLVRDESAVGRLLMLLGSNVVKERLKRCAARVESQLRPYLSQAIPVQPVIRDLWHDHLMFAGDRLTGIVDFGSLAMDSIVLDLTRLLRSLFGSDREGWDLAVADYQRTRPLMQAEIELLKPLDAANVILSAVNWVRWVVVEGREFEDSARVEQRIQRLTHGLLELLEIDSI